MFRLVFFPYSWSSVNTVGERSLSSSHAIVCWHRITTLMTIPPKAPQFTLLRSSTGILRGSISTPKKEHYKSRDLQVCLFIRTLLSCTESIEKFWVCHQTNAVICAQKTGILFGKFIKCNYYRACVCSPYNVRSDWLILAHSVLLGKSQTSSLVLAETFP